MIKPVENQFEIVFELRKKMTIIRAHIKQNYVHYVKLSNIKNVLNVAIPILVSVNSLHINHM